MTTNIERFDVVAGAVFAYLYEQFPVPVDLDYQQVEVPENQSADAQTDWSLWLEGAPQKAGFLAATVDWLASTGYLTFKSKSEGCAFTGVVLTAKGLEVLKAAPKSLRTDPSLGETLVKAAKSGLSDQVRDLTNSILKRGYALAATTAAELINNAL